MKNKKTGTRTSAIELSPRRRKKNAARRRQEEKEWAAKSGPVVSYFDPSKEKEPHRPSRKEGEALS